LPQNWTEDRERRRKAGVREEISFKTKPESALEHLRDRPALCAVSPDGRWLRRRDPSLHKYPDARIERRRPARDGTPRSGRQARRCCGPKNGRAEAITEADAPRPQSEVCRHIHAAMLNRKTVTTQEFMTLQNLGTSS
jgi:hypothetical protein